MSKYKYTTNGTCSKEITFEIDDCGLLHNLSFVGGCNGNLKGIGRLTEGMDALTVADKLEGTKCGARNTSCPDQLSRAIKEALKNN